MKIIQGFAGRATLAVAFFTLLSSLALPSAAQTGFSRACHFPELGTISQQVYYNVTRQTVNGIPVNTATYEVKSRLWALESITADYGSFRYWLWAGSAHYLWGRYFRHFTVPVSTRSLFDNNRGLATSVRAGHNMSAYMNGTQGVFEMLTPELYQVWGSHYIYEPFGGQMQFLGISKATNCNCAQWGFQFSWANDFLNFFCTNY